VYRIGFILVMVLAVSLGVVIGALNPQIVSVDLLWFNLAWPLGLTLICVLLAGVMLGLVLTGLFSVWPLKVQLRKARKELGSHSTNSSTRMDIADV
jgi:uncharacterized membrane protein YciS (DUF1049 family)